MLLNAQSFASVSACSIIIWLSHWYIAPDVLDRIQWTWISENMFNLSSLTLSLIYRTWCCSILSHSSPWVYVQLSSLTLSLVYHTWPARGTPMDVDQWEYVKLSSFDFVTDISHPSAVHAGHAQHVSSWVYIQWSYLTLSLIYHFWFCSMLYQWDPDQRCRLHLRE